MTHPVTSILTIALAGALSTAAAGAQAFPNQSAAATATPASVARVYVQTAKGVNVYTTSSTGKLTLVSGSPFKNTVGLMIGTAGSHFITVGTTYLHSYAIKSTGAIGAQVAQINTALYSGAADCGTTHGGTIDRTGTEAYIQLDGTGQCAALQTFKINATSGAFTFGGVAEFGGGTQPVTIESPLVVTGNNGHAYTFTQYYCENEFSRFYRDSFGAMNVDDSGTITLPPPDPGGVYFPLAMASDNQNLPTSHMAVAIHRTSTIHPATALYHPPWPLTPSTTTATSPMTALCSNPRSIRRRWQSTPRAICWR